MLFKEFEGKVHFFTEYKTAVAEAYERDMAKVLADSKNLKLFEEAIRNNTGNGQQYFDDMSESAKNLAEQVGVLAANGKDATSIIDGFTASQRKTTEATYLATSRVKGFSMQMVAMLKSMAVVFLVTQAIQIALAVSDKLIVTYEEQRTKYEEAKQEAEQLNEELKTTQDRLIELGKIESKSIIEQTEYDKLVKTNAELYRRKTLLDAIAKTQQEKTYKAYLKENITDQSDFGFTSGSGSVWGTDFLSTSADRIAMNLAEIDSAKKQAEYYGETDLDGNIRDIEKSQHYYDKLTQLKIKNAEYMEEVSSTALKSAESIEYVSNATEEWQIQTNKALTATYLISDATNYLNGEIGSLGNLLENSDYSSLKSTVVELIENGKLSGKTLSSNPAFSGLLGILSSVGIKAEDVAASFAVYFKEIASGKEETLGFAQSLSEFNTYIDALQSSYDTLNKAINEYNSVGNMSIDTLQSLLQMNPEYLSFLDVENGKITINTEKYKSYALSKIASMMVDLTEAHEKNLKRLDEERDAIEENSRAYQALTVDKMTSIQDFKKQIDIIKKMQEGIEDGTLLLGSETKADIFEREKALLDIQKSRMDSGMKSSLTSTEDYYNKLEGLVRNYYSVISKEYQQYEVEIFQGRKAILEQEMEDIKHQTSLLEKKNEVELKIKKLNPYFEYSIHTGAEDGKIIANYRELQARVHKLAEEYRKINEAENQDLINALQQQWWEYEANIEGVYDRLADSALNYANKMKETEQAYLDARLNGISTLTGALSDAADEVDDEANIRAIFDAYEERIKNVDLTVDPTGYEDALAIMERSLEFLTRQADKEKEIEESKEWQLKLDEAALKLENARKDKKVKVLQKQADGSWDYVYEADDEEVKKAEKKDQEVKNDYAKWEAKQVARKIADEYEDLAFGIGRQARNLTDSYATVETLINSSLENLKIKFGKDIPTIQGYLTQMIDDIMIKVKSGSGGVNTGIVTSPPSSSPSSSGSIIENLTKISSDTTLEYLENKIKWQKASDAGDTATMTALNKRNSELRAATGILTDVIGTKEAEAMLKKIRGYSTGGMNTTPGLAMLHGTKKEPEVILNESHAAKLWNLLTQPISAVGRSVSDSGLFDKFFASMALQTSGGVTYNFNNLKVELPNVKDGDSAASLFDGLSNFAFQYANKR